MPPEKPVKKIQVRIQCSQRVTYDQVVEMTRDELKELQLLADKNPRLMSCPLQSPLNDWLDLRDVNDGQEFDDAYFTEVKEKKKPKEPTDAES